MTKSLSYAGIGARLTPVDILQLMSGVAANLEELGWTLRTGGAQGADSAFFGGLATTDLVEVYIPWEGFQGFTRANPQICNIADLTPSLLNTAFAVAEEHHPAWHMLTGPAQRLMARNSFQVLGPDLETPSDCVICWTPKGEIKGGTGQALRIAASHDIPVINLGSCSLEEAEDIISGLLEENPPF